MRSGPISPRETSHLQYLEIDDIEEEDLKWLRRLDETTEMIKGPEEILEAIADGSMQAWRLVNGPKGLMLTEVTETSRTKNLEVFALVGEYAMNYMQGIVDDLLGLARYVNATKLIYIAENLRFGKLIAERCNAELFNQTYVWRL